MTADTIFALSSGAPPAAIGVVRLSGPDAGAAVTRLSGMALPPARRAVVRRLRDGRGDLLDQALVLWLPGPGSATGEDMAELHCHGGRAVIAAVERALADLPGCRRAEPGEFTRRAFANGRIDLAEAEGLGDLLAAETELQRRAAAQLVEGRFSAQVNRWRHALLGLAASVEAALDFAEDDGIAGLPSSFSRQVRELADELESWLGRPRAERLKDGVRVVIAGPPNSGKSTLFNALVEDEAAITSPVAGTTRDALERPIALSGVPFTLVDTAGLREHGADSIELEGIRRARSHASDADLVLWLGAEGEGPEGASVLEIDARIDEAGHAPKREPAARLSAVTGSGLEELRALLLDRARVLLPRPGDMALNGRQAELIGLARQALRSAAQGGDELVIAENLRHARLAFDRLLGRAATEDMLDALFARFCIGK